MNYYYEKSGLLDSPVNITYHEVFNMSDGELVTWIDKVREYVVKEWDEKGVPPMIGKSTEEIVKSFRKLRDYNARGFVTRDDDGNEDIVKNFNLDATAVNQFFPTMMKTKISKGRNETVSIYDNFKLDKYKNSFRNGMMRGVRRDSMYVFSKSVSFDRKENEQGGPIYWDDENFLRYMECYR